MLVLAIVAASFAAPPVSAGPTGDCITFLTTHASLVGPELSMGDTITLLLGASPSEAGMVAGVIIDPNSCGNGGVLEEYPVTHTTSLLTAPTLPDVPAPAPLLP